MFVDSPATRQEEYCRRVNEHMERERMIESWRVAGLTDEERRDEQFERDERKLNSTGTCGKHGFSEERVKEIIAWATAKWRRLNPEKAAASDAALAAIRAAHEADIEKERLRVEAEANRVALWRAQRTEFEAARRRRPQVHDVPAKKKATIVNGVLTWA